MDALDDEFDADLPVVIDAVDPMDVPVRGGVDDLEDRLASAVGREPDDDAFEIADEPVIVRSTSMDGITDA